MSDRLDKAVERQDEVARVLSDAISGVELALDAKAAFAAFQSEASKVIAAAGEAAAPVLTQMAAAVAKSLVQEALESARRK